MAVSIFSSILRTSSITFILLMPRYLICLGPWPCPRTPLLYFNLPFPFWCPTNISNLVCSSFYSLLPSRFHTQNKFLCLSASPLSSQWLKSRILKSFSLFSQVSKFPQAFPFQSVLSAQIWIQAFILLHLNRCHSLQALPQHPALSPIPLPV